VKPYTFHSNTVPLSDFTFNGLREPIITEALVAIEKTNQTYAAKIAHQALEITTLPFGLLHANDEEHPLNNGL
jgi:hypothetical protein